MRSLGSSAIALGALGAVLGAVGPSPAPAQGVIHGLAYDSLVRGPLAGAAVWIPGVDRHAVADSAGRFLLRAVPGGTHVVALTHPQLEPAGLAHLAAAVTVTGRDGDTARVTLSVPSLATMWLLGCRDTLGLRVDSGIVRGLIADAATGARLVGAEVRSTWIRLLQQGTKDVLIEEHEARSPTDSLGAFMLCGVSTEVVVRIRAYAGGDSTGGVDLRVDARGVARQDLTLARAAGAPARTAALRGIAHTTEGVPVAGARVIVHEAASGVTRPDGTFLLAGLPAGTQWVTVLAIGRERSGQAVDLTAGDTTTIGVALGPLPIALAPIEVLGVRGARLMADFHARRGAGRGYARTEAELRSMGTMRAVFTSIPAVRFQPRRSVFDNRVYLPGGARGSCLATLYIDGELASFEQLNTYRTADLVGVEVFVRVSDVPPEFQLPGSLCGAVLVWTKHLR